LGERCRIFDAPTWTIEQDKASPTSVPVGVTETNRPRGMWGNEDAKFAARSRWRHMFSWQMTILKKGPQKKSVSDLDPSSFF
jgi:hypothetical protein